MSPPIEIMPDPPDKEGLAPLPAYLENHRRRITNFGLFFQKFSRYHIKGRELKTQASWNNRQKGRARREYIWSLPQNQIDHYATHKQAANQVLAERHKHQSETLASLSALKTEILDWPVCALTRFLTGIGETSPTEVGMLFDRNTGLPFISASSIKGSVRMAFVSNFVQSIDLGDKTEIDEKDVPGLIELFGSSDSKDARRGGFAFLDAFPNTLPELVLDIMNPHFGAYYRGEGPPTEVEDPKPIQFLTVEKGASFTVRGYYLNPAAQAFHVQLVAALQTAFTDHGMGAKTAVGYGRFITSDGGAGFPEASVASPGANLGVGPASSAEIKPPAAARETPPNETWTDIHLTFTPNNQEVAAISGDKKAFCKGLDDVPEAIAKQLKKKKKARAAEIEVEPIGNAYKIIRVSG